VSRCTCVSHAWCRAVSCVQRLAAGAFTRTLEFLFHHLTGNRLVVQEFGKPLPVTFNFAMDKLLKWKAQCGFGDDPFSTVFMVGDNPRADVRGANTAGLPWQSVLVETGVFKPTREHPNDPIDPAKFVCKGVEEAVAVVLAAANAK
jgi:ribonucleotide monophosphatase NagD (HAD superfamily)